jgi:nucleoside-triphosphatase THEP1
VRVPAWLLAVVAVVLAFLSHPLAPALALLAAVASVLLLEPAALRRAWSLRALVLVVAASALAAAAVGWSSAPAKGLAVGGAVLLRFLVLLLLTALASRHVDAEAVQRVAARVGLTRLGLALGLALNALPHLGEAARDAWTALAVRGRRSRPRVAALPRLAEILLAHTGRVAEEAAAAAALRGHRSLVRALPPAAARPFVVVVTGRPAAGKTRAMRGVAQALRERGVRVAGFVQVPVWEASGRGGYLVLDVASGEQRTLAAKVGAERGEHGTPFRFEAAGFAFARRAAERAATVLVVDELGPVELRGGGHMPAVRSALAREGIAAALVTVRPALIPSLLAEFAVPSAVIVNVEEERDPVAALLAALAPVLPPSSS